ncbi:cupin-like domain-containing protein [Phenylobacterium sp.]|uniref:cupin-like domain-containing protein n=1 Tax=Phenylobacterium sp. TaxID=1871053 RepID=UPI003BAB78D0
MPELMPSLLPDQAALAGREILTFKHRLAETGLFTDEALVRLLDEHPRDQLTVCTMAENPPPDQLWIAGEAGKLSGAELLEAAKRGALWLSPRSALKINPRYRRVFEALSAEFSAKTGVKVAGADAAVLISSPRMGIYFHVDPGETMLWHVRGHKTIRLYPPTQDFVSEESLQAILMKETLSDLPYRAEMEPHARPVALSPGEAVYWPLHSPHRVTNGDDLNVSMSMDFASPHSRLVNGVFHTHAVLRRRLGLKLGSRATPAVLRPAYLAASLVLKRLVPLGTVERDHTRQFDIDLAAPGCVRWREGFGPDVRKAA